MRRVRTFDFNGLEKRFYKTLLTIGLIANFIEILEYSRTERSFALIAEIWNL